MNIMMSLKSTTLLLLGLTLLVTADETEYQRALGYKFNHVAGCSGNDISIDSLLFQCSSGRDTCLTGEEVNVYGTCKLYEHDN